MPEPPEGEANLRGLAHRFEIAESQIRELLVEAVVGNRRRHTRLALEILTALRRLDYGTAVLLAYLTAFRSVSEGRPGDVSDLMASLAKRLDRGAQKAQQSVREAFSRVAAENLDEMSNTAVTAHIDERGTSWSLSRWADMNCSTIGRQASSRGLGDGLGEGSRFVVDVGECERCRELFTGELIVGRDPLPPGHVNCTCVASPA